MRIITNASARLEANAKAVATTLASAEALAKDAAWQATLAGMRERFPNGVMHSA